MFMSRVSGLGLTFELIVLITVSIRQQRTGLFNYPMSTIFLEPNTELHCPADSDSFHSLEKQP